MLIKQANSGKQPPMKAIHCLILVLLFASVQAQATGAGLQSQSQLPLTSELSTSDLSTWLKGRPILFIGGFTGREVLQHFFHYMKDFEQEALRLGMKPKILCPSSLLGDEESVDLIHDAIEALYSTADFDSEGKRKGVIVVGHSKGASRLWVTVLNRPKSLDMIEEGISLQGCFGGSFIMGHTLPWHSRALELLGTPGIQALKTAPDGANSVHKTLAAVILEKHDPRSDAGKAFLKKAHRKLHYIKTEISSDELSFFSWSAQKFSLRSSSEPNDGMVSVEHQQVNSDTLFQLLSDGTTVSDLESEGVRPVMKKSYLSLGTPLHPDHLKADHVALTTNLMDWSGLISGKNASTPEGRQSFLYGVLQKLHQKRVIANPPQRS